MGAVPLLRDGHLFSAYLMMPLAATTLALLAFNWYPAQVRMVGVKCLAAQESGFCPCSRSRQCVHSQCRCLLVIHSPILRAWHSPWQASWATFLRRCSCFSSRKSSTLFTASLSSSRLCLAPGTGCPGGLSWHRCVRYGPCGCILVHVGAAQKALTCWLLAGSILRRGFFMPPPT